MFKLAISSGVGKGGFGDNHPIGSKQQICKTFLYNEKIVKIKKSFNEK